MSSGKKKQKINHAKYPPSSLVQLLGADDWESFIEDCCRVEMNHNKKYRFVQRIGGSGDAGRDVEARYTDELKEGEWDLYQAKHYTGALGESTLYPELAKVLHHISIGTYPAPRNYYICAPKNTTPKLHDLIAHPDKLKVSFLGVWQQGKYGINLKQFPLTEPTVTVANAFDYSKIKIKPVKDLISLHAQDSIAHEQLFGVEHARGDNPEPPKIPVSEELIYVSQLLRVYSEHAGSQFSLEDVMNSEEYGEHLMGCRGEFYSAEGLKRFSTEVLPGEFENLMSSVYVAIRRVATSLGYDDSMKKLEAVLDAASKLQVSGNPLHRRLLPADLPGTCHHLVNEEKLKWVK